MRFAGVGLVEEEVEGVASVATVNIGTGVFAADFSGGLIVGEGLEKLLVETAF